MDRRVLIVDDDETIRATLRIVLERAGWVVHTHDSGFGLIVAMRQIEPQVVLLDVEMPGLNGDAALRAVREIERLPFMPPRIVLFSGQSEAELQARCDTCGAWGYLTKPASTEDILETVENALRQCSVDERWLWARSSGT